MMSSLVRHAYSLTATEPDLSQARKVWEASDQEPAFGETMICKMPPPHWIEAEAQLPDGRRVFGAK